MKDFECKFCVHFEFCEISKDCCSCVGEVAAVVHPNEKNGNNAAMKS
jgi:hypothetical protein